MGVMRGYVCDRCPLAFEIGGYVYWSLDGRCEQVVCLACGTMHRLEERHGDCQVTALPGPVPTLPYVTKRLATGEEFQMHEWPFTDEDWRAVGQHPGGIKALDQLACSRCGTLGRMQSLTLPPHPDGHWVSFREVCPLCGGPMPFVYDSTVN